MSPIAISILLPVRNEAKFILSCLDHIFQQEGIEGDFEVIIADGMSTDNTREIIHAFQVVNPNLILIDNPGKIVPTGLNLAIRQAKGDVIIRVDGHCEIAKDYVKNCIVHLTHDHVDGVGGPMQTIGETPFSKTIAIAMSSRFGVGGSAFRTTSGKTKITDSVPFPAYTRGIIERVGLYDEELVRNQDDEYNYRIRKAGGKILLAADVQSVYFSRGTLKSLWKQYYQYGYWKVRVLQKHPRQMSLRHFIPPAFSCRAFYFSPGAFVELDTACFGRRQLLVDQLSCLNLHLDETRLAAPSPPAIDLCHFTSLLRTGFLGRVDQIRQSLEG